MTMPHSSMRRLVATPVPVCNHWRKCECPTRKAARQLKAPDRQLIAIYKTDQPDNALYLTPDDFNRTLAAISNGDIMNPGGRMHQKIGLGHTKLILRWATQPPVPTEDFKGMSGIYWTLTSTATEPTTLNLTTPEVIASRISFDPNQDPQQWDDIIAIPA